MFRTITVMLALALLPLAGTSEAQGGRNQNRNDVARAQGIPPGQMPPANMCRVWYDGRPPGQQPGPTSCDRAEAIASRDRSARVIYGADSYGYGRYDNNRNGTYGGSYPYPDNERGVSRPGRNRAPNGGGYNSGPRYGDTAYQNGYRDGRAQGLEDGRDNERFDPTRHGRYRAADRGYLDSYGNKGAYRDSYRVGFRAGYEDAYQATGRRY